MQQAGQEGVAGAGVSTTSSFEGRIGRLAPQPPGQAVGAVR